MLIAAYQDWISFDRQDRLLLDTVKLHLVLRHLSGLELSLDLMAYLLCCVAWGAASAPSGAQMLAPQMLAPWLRRSSRDDIAAVFERLLQHPTPRVRQGAMVLVQRLRVTQAAQVVARHLAREIDRKVRRAGARCLVTLDQRLPDNLAHAILGRDTDWLMQTLALLGRADRRACLLVGDDSAFAADLGAFAAAAGFAPVVSAGAVYAPGAGSEALAVIGASELDLLRAYSLVILVRGEHYTRYGCEDFYTRLREFVSAGGALLATPWVGWETIHHKELAEVLPFAYTPNGFDEDIWMQGKATGDALAVRLFPEPIELRASVERLRARAGSVVLLETGDGLPLFGYRHFGAGTCHYLNACQHTCLGTMPSPVFSSAGLRASLERVLRWIAHTPEQRSHDDHDR